MAYLFELIKAFDFIFALFYNSKTYTTSSATTRSWHAAKILVRTEVAYEVDVSG
jgi:hypothetical protein